MASERFSGALSPEAPYAAPIDAEVPVEGEAAPEFQPDQVERALFEIQNDQHLMLGAAAGAIAGAIGATIWAAVTIATGFQIGWLAVGIGFLVGAAVRGVGRGTTSAFGIVGAVLALVSVAAGNFLSVLGLFAGELEISYFEMATRFDYSQSFAIMAATFSPMDLLFYGIAVWEGYRFSIREVTPEEIRERLAADGVSPARAQ